MHIVFAEDYSDRETGRYLERMGQATGRWVELIQSANTWLQGETDPAQRIRLCLRLAKWYGEDLGHPEYAQPYYAQIVQLDPNNVSVLRQMGSLYRKNGQWQQFGQTLTRALDVATTDLDRKEILTDLGELLERQMNEVDQALTHYTRALEIDALHLPALEALERIYTARGMNRELCDVLARKVKAWQGPRGHRRPQAAHRPSTRTTSTHRGGCADLPRSARRRPARCPRCAARAHLRRVELAGLVGVLEQNSTSSPGARHIDVLMTRDHRRSSS
jgi:tetratricopeptide (TPR) repeat protein